MSAQEDQATGVRVRARRARALVVCVLEVLLGALVYYSFPELRGGTMTGEVGVPLVTRLVSVAVAVTVLSLTSTVFLDVVSSPRRRTFSSLALTTGRSMAGWSLGVPYFHLSAILFGAPVSDLCMETLLWSVIMSALGAGPLASSSSLRQLHKITFLPPSFTGQDLVPRFRLLGSLVGAWLGATLIPLDWAQPWQEWPLTVTVGAVLGHSLGAVVALAVEARRRGGGGEAASSAMGHAAAKAGVVPP